MAQQGQVFPLAGRQGDATRWAYRYRRTESQRPQPAPLDGGDEVVAGRVRPEREQAGDGYRIQAVAEITVDLQEIREQEGRGERDDEAASEPCPVSRDARPRSGARPRAPAKCMCAHDCSFLYQHCAAAQIGHRWRHACGCGFSAGQRLLVGLGVLTLQRRKIGPESELASLALRDDDAGSPARGSSARRKRDRANIEPAAREDPRDGRVRVPHLTGAEFVASPDGRRHLRHELEDPAGAIRVVAQAERTRDRLGDIGDDAVAPAADLVAKEPEAPRRARADRTSCDDTRSARRSTPVRARSRTAPPARALRAPNGRGRSALDLQAAPRQPRRPSFQSYGVAARAPSGSQ